MDARGSPDEVDIVPGSSWVSSRVRCGTAESSGVHGPQLHANRRRTIERKGREERRARADECAIASRAHCPVWYADSITQSLPVIVPSRAPCAYPRMGLTARNSSETVCSVGQATRRAVVLGLYLCSMSSLPLAVPWMVIEASDRLRCWGTSPGGCH